MSGPQWAAFVSGVLASAPDDADEQWCEDVAKQVWDLSASQVWEHVFALQLWSNLLVERSVSQCSCSDSYNEGDSLVRLGYQYLFMATLLVARSIVEWRSRERVS
jgi:hypothetical protein